MEMEFVAIPAQVCVIGSNEHYPEESPQHARQSEAFQMATTAVTNRQFARFVEATGYRTTAEQPLPDHLVGPDDPLRGKAGSLVFTPTERPVDLRDPSQWWQFVPDACWWAPQGPGSSLRGREDHPVVQVSYVDAVAYCEWAQARLPTEYEWEVAARGGLQRAEFTWGAEEFPDGQPMAKTYVGNFPWDNHDAQHPATMPADSFAPNGYGLYCMTGNVWEWTSSPYSSRHRAADEEPAKVSEPARPCCGPMVHEANADEVEEILLVLKGGSFLCTRQYCFRYRPAARSPQDTHTSTNHTGFRCARDR